MLLLIPISHACLPQNWKGDERTAEEWATFDRALSCMVKFYASVTATCVIQQRHAPERPTEYDGCISILHQTATTDVSKLLKTLSRYGEVVGEIELVPSFGPGKREAHARFATHAQAERAIAGLKKSSNKVTAIPVYNGRSYDGVADGRGWTIFEQGVALTTAAHLLNAAKQKELLPRFASATAARPKLIDITGELPVARDAEVADADPTKVLHEAIKAALATSWVGNKAKVEEMLHEFEWLIKTAVESAQVDPLDITLDPRIHIPSFAARLSNRSSMHVSRRSEVPRSSAAVESEEALELNDEEDEGNQLSIVTEDEGAMGAVDAGIRLQSV